MLGNKDLVLDYDLPHPLIRNIKVVRMSEWKKVEDKIYKFEKEGDLVEGHLIDKQRGANYDNEVYKIRDKNQNIVTVFSTAVMESQMRLVKIGDQVKIVYVGTKESKKKGHNPLKLFEVFSK